MTEAPILGSGSIVLRPLRTGDRDRLATIQRTPGVARWWGEVGDDDFVVEVSDPDNDTVQLVIEIDDTVAGLIQFGEEDDPMYRSANIDVFLDPAFHRRGIGRESIRLVARYLIDVRGHHRITIDPSAANVTAIAVYGSLGFRPVGVLRQYERDADGTGWHDGLLMDLLAGELRG